VADHNELGEKGEKLALNYLIKKGYRILEKNFRFGKNEVDIIAEKDDFLVIVEVKTRSSQYYGEPESFVNKRKQSFMVRAANYYLSKYRLDNEVRFDIISVLVSSYGNKITHIEDAFYPTL
jgi:putative endonuclease